MTDKKEWLNIISKLNNDFSKMLYLISYLEEINLINNEQKIFLKKLLLINSNSLLSFLNDIKKNKSIEIFYEYVIKLISEEDTNNEDLMNISEHKKKHLISISSNSWNEEITKDEYYNDNYK